MSQIGAQRVLPKCVHFANSEPSKFSAVDNTCDVTWLTSKQNIAVIHSKSSSSWRL